MTNQELIARLEAMDPMEIVRRGGRYLLVMPYSRMLRQHMQELFGEYGAEVGWKFFPSANRIEHTSGGIMLGMTLEMIAMRRHRGWTFAASNSTDPDIRAQIRPTETEVTALLKAEG